eukprot:3004779-Rhodomonas_salina.1
MSRSVGGGQCCGRVFKFNGLVLTRMRVCVRVCATVFVCAGACQWGRSDWEETEKVLVHGAQGSSCQH